MKFKKSVSVSIDELTVVLMPAEKLDCMEWLDKAETMIQTFIDNSRLETLYGKMVNTDRGIQRGYTHGITVTDKPFYLCISWHEDFSNMGICCRFSAQAWATYQTDFSKRYDTDMNVATFLRMVQSDGYITRLSRIDFVADYKNYHRSVEPDIIYRGLKDGTLKIKDYKNRNMIKTKTALDKDGVYSTIYLGSRKANTRCFCRIYDKRLEQIQTNGFRYDEAIQCKSWIRQEVVFKGTYAHQITDELINSVHTPYDLQAFIAKMISDKFRFYETDTLQHTKYTRALLNIVGNNNFIFLGNTSPRDNDLKRSINHIMKGSGLYPTLYKTLCVWGEGADKELIQYLLNEYEKFYIDEAKKNKEINMWLRKHQTTLNQYTLQDYLHLQ